jgi:hypothetical protein
MFARGDKSNRQPGQVMILFVLAFAALCLMVGVVIDGGYGLTQRRAAQNAADFAALAGARIIAEKIGGDLENGTDANVRLAIEKSIALNGARPIPWGPPSGPVYVTQTGDTITWVGGGWLPSNAVGVRLSASMTWQPFFLGIMGVSSWTASAEATARGGFRLNPGGAFPFGVAEAFFNGRSTCDGPIAPGSGGPCDPAHLTQGKLNIPGGFGWLKFGCDGYGLGQDPPANAGGCDNDKGFVQSEIDTGNTYGCCSRVGLPGSLDLIGSGPGNMVSIDCSSIYGKIVTVPVWDYADDTGNNAYYHIVGFTGFQITQCDGAKEVYGVWRQQMSLGPTTNTPGFAGQDLAIQLVH